MTLHILGCSHRTCPMVVRERLVVDPEELPSFLRDFRVRFPDTEAVLLSTCNRTELYVASRNHTRIPGKKETVAFLAQRHGVHEPDLWEAIYHRQHADAIRHLFLVTASLDSLVVGETQILSQVKHAYEASQRQASTGRLTHTAFQSALRVGRRVARETEIHRHRVSIPSVAVRVCAGQVFERLSDKRVLVIGGGEMALETLRCLREEGARQISLVHRDWSKGIRLAVRHGCRAVEWQDLLGELSSADLVVSATSARDPIVRVDSFRHCVTKRQQRPLLILDLAVPRDFDPRIGRCLGVYLYSMDDLDRLSASHRQARESELPRALQIVEQETQRFMGSLDQRRAEPAIRQLLEAARHTQVTELNEYFAKHAELDEFQRLDIRRRIERETARILHPLLLTLRDRPDHLADASRKLNASIVERVHFDY